MIGLQTMATAAVNHRRYSRSQFVRDLVDSHGWPFDEACDAMGIDPADYWPRVEPYTIKAYMPRQGEILAKAAAIRSGDIKLSEKSVKRWAVIRDDVDRMESSEDAQRYRFELAGQLDDDACPMPAWFKGQS